MLRLPGQKHGSFIQAVILCLLISTFVALAVIFAVNLANVHFLQKHGKWSVEEYMDYEGVLDEM